MRQISLDTETTGLFYYQGHRIIEIGCVEIINKKITGNVFHTYVNPERQIDKDAKKITGLTDIFLKTQPTFENIIDDLFNFINKADEIIIHNALFDISFINNELKIINYNIKNIRRQFKIFDTLDFARKLHPGKKNNLNALCERYNISIADRTLHGALLDANLLAQVYIEMTLYKKQDITNFTNLDIESKIKKHLKILSANKQEVNIHSKYVEILKNKAKIL